MSILSPLIRKLRKEKDLGATLMAKHPRRRHLLEDEEYMMEMTSALFNGHDPAVANSMYGSQGRTSGYTPGFSPTAETPGGYSPYYSPSYSSSFNSSDYSPGLPSSVYSPASSAASDTSDDEDEPSYCSSRTSLSDDSGSLPSTPVSPSSVPLDKALLSNKGALDTLLNAHFIMHSPSSPFFRTSFRGGTTNKHSPSQTPTYAPYSPALTLPDEPPTPESFYFSPRLPPIQTTLLSFPPSPPPSAMLASPRKAADSIPLSRSHFADKDALEDLLLEHLYEAKMAL